MFKKVSKSNKHASRKRRSESDDDDDKADNETAADADAISQLQATKKRRQLLTKLQYRRGVDARDLLVAKKDSTAHVPEDGGAAEKETISADLPGTQAAAPPESKVWQDKHAAALESFVQERLRQSQPKDSTEKNHADALSKEEKTTKAPSKAALYQKLAVQAAQWAGKEQEQQTDNKDTSEVLAGAATALAEGVLPVRERLDAVAETAQAAAAHSSPNRGSRTSQPQAVPNRFRVYNTNSSNMKSFPGTAASSEPPRPATTAADDDASDAVDAERAGFAAARQNRPTTQQYHKNKQQQQQRSSDDRVYQQFVKRQREQQR